MDNKRGLSTIVATLIIILLVLVAVGVVWIVVRNVISEGAEQVSLGKFTLDLSIEQVQLGENQISVKVKRNSGEGDFVALKFILDDGDLTEVVEYNGSLKELEQRTFVLNLQSVNGSKIKKIQIAPVFRLSSGKEVTGDIKDEYVISGGAGSYSGTIEPQCTLDSECNDNYNGTIDTCSSGNCVNTDITDCLDDDNFCPSGCTTINDNNCVACTLDSECNDNNQLTIDTCPSGVCVYTFIAPPPAPPTPPGI